MSNDIQHHINVYKKVFIALLILTVLTVAASYFEFGGIVWLAIGVGLAIATLKGYLVAANFMHLNDEKPIIYQTLAGTVFALIILFFMPLMWHNDGLKSPDNVPLQNGNVYNSDFESHHDKHEGGHH
tara:strand:+ start:4183 stop:4563 length:381 start_codon:yes stop_codon:yes gene_type:complete